MSKANIPPGEPPLPPTVQTRAEFVAAIHWAVRTAAERGARQMVWVDPDFADWPLNEPALHGVLTAWLATPRRRLLLLAEHYDALPRSHPRFVAWRRNWAHAIEPRIQPDDESGGLPTLLIDDGPVEPWQPPSTLAQTTNQRSVSIARPGPTTPSHHPALG